MEREPIEKRAGFFFLRQGGLLEREAEGRWMGRCEGRLYTKRGF